ncbi:RimJ/RimL family protein N-acetyltransferase [Thermocatellispora tengchongensis]|uniref:RimJ/RimL family protein N-acetyltransferase n=1 Tax=Thermocatellispora tengchongensis TaxID=1073253 RepID=A0A840PN06_9ACTN|nr:RimJ/RimL family protein N-acetyltransferase [Thermocatellispora tengchongensis]
MTVLSTERLTVRDWTVEDAPEALRVYGTQEVTRWLSPAMTQIQDEQEMREVLESWIRSAPELAPPLGRWAIVRNEDQRVIGGLTLRYLPPDNEDIEIGWQLAPEYWGHGYASEAGRALAKWAFSRGAGELVAVVRVRNERGSGTAKRLGMQWVGETEKYYGMRLDVYRLWPSDLTPEADKWA